MKLEIKNLHARIEEKEILKGINLTLESGQVTALMGPNGSGKSTLSNVIMGHPKYEVTEGEILLDGQNVLEMDVHERARAGLYLAFQYPTEVPGITVGKFLKRAVEVRQPKDEPMNVSAYIKELREAMKFMEMDQKFINRYLNEGFSGGEKKRMEVLQMLMLKPIFSIMDETDSGLDIDALRIVSKGVNALRGDSFGALIITHYQRILDYIQPDNVHILVDGKIVFSGGPDLVNELEEKGYGWIKEDMEVGA